MTQATPKKSAEMWRNTTLGNEFRWSSGGTPKSTVASYYGGGIPWAIIGDLNDGLVTETATTISEEGLKNSATKWVEEGSVLVAMYGSIGKLGIAGKRMTTNQAIAFTKPECCSAKFLFWYLYSSRSALLGLGKGGTQSNISQTVLKAFPFVLPPEGDRERIVAEIEKQFTRLEAGVAALRRVQANLKRYRAAVLKAGCEGRLVPTEAELAKAENRRFETGEELLARILAERRKNWHGRGKYNEPVAPGKTKLPTIPEGWTWTALEAVSEAVGGFAFSSTKFGKAGFQVVKMANVRMGKIDLTQKPSFISDVAPGIVEKYNLREGDLVVTLTGTRKKRDYGYVAVVKNQDGLLLNQRIARVRPSAGMDSKFLQLAMQAEYYRDRFFSHETGNVGQGNVGMAAVTKEMVTLPPLAEQTRIVAEVERRLSVVEELESVVSANLQRATRLRQSILHENFTLQLVQAL
jgi:type I restriction enzyme, S subunit